MRGKNVIGVTALVALLAGGAVVAVDGPGEPRPVAVEDVQAVSVASVKEIRLADLALSQRKVHGGLKVRATVSLTKPAGGTGLRVTVKAPGLKAPAKVKIKTGKRSASFWIGTSAVKRTAARKITVTFGKSSRTRTLTVLPLPVLKSITLPLRTLTIGGSAVGQVKLSAAAQPGGSRIALASNARDVRVPASVLVPAGSSAVSFRLTTAASAKPRSVTLTARRGKIRVTTTLRLTAIAPPPAPPAPKPTPSPSGSPTKPPVPSNSPSPSKTPTPTPTPTKPADPVGPAVSGVIVEPFTVKTGETAQATVTLEGPAGKGGTPVALVLEGEAGYAEIPAKVIVPEGKSEASFTVKATAPEDDPVYTPLTVEATTIGETRYGSFASVPPLRLRSITVPKALYGGGSTAEGVVTLNGPADQTVWVDIKTESPLNPVDPVVIGYGQSYYNYYLGTDNPSAPVVASVKASWAGTERTAKTRVVPGFVSLHAVQLPDGWAIPERLPVTVRLAGPADKNVPISLTDPREEVYGRFELPGTVVIPAGADSLTFDLVRVGYERTARATLLIAGAKVGYSVSFGSESSMVVGFCQGCLPS